MKRLMQGDSYNIPIHIKASDGTTVTKQSAICVEIVIGWLKKCFPGEITFSDGAWLFPISQEESLSIVAHEQPVQVRVKFADGSVVGATSRKKLIIESSRSKDVL